MRPEIKAAIIALHELENVTIEEFGLLRVEIDKIEDELKKSECKKIFEEQVCKSDNVLLKTFLKEHNIDSMGFEKVINDNEFISSIVFYSKNKSIAFQINSSDYSEFVSTCNNIEIIAYTKDTQKVRDNIGFDISYFTNNEIEIFLELIDSFLKDAYELGLFVEFE